MAAVTDRPGDPSAATQPAAAPRFRVALEYAVHGDLRFISHRDELRVLARALVRADWPLHYSQGFNPAPFVSVALPRSTGMASEHQVALIDLNAEPTDPQRLLTSLARTLPGAMPIARMIVTDVPRSLHPRRVVYECPLPAADAAALATRLAGSRAADPLFAERTAADSRAAPPLDAGPCIDTLTLRGDLLRLALRFEDGRSVRPRDVLNSLGLAVDECGHRLRRVEVAWNEPLAGRAWRPAATAGPSNEPAVTTLADRPPRPAADHR